MGKKLIRRGGFSGAKCRWRKLCKFMDVVFFFFFFFVSFMDCVVVVVVVVVVYADYLFVG